VNKLAPFGEGNKEPLFLLENVTIKKIEKVWQKAKTHLKIHGQFGENKINAMFRGKWDEVKDLQEDEISVNLIWKVKKDTFNGGYFLDGASWEF
jgi:single-stranded DNA-specific DHH superfamily exonuclease